MEFPSEGSISELDDVLTHRLTIQAVFIAIPSLSRKRRKEIDAVCVKHGVAIKRLQRFEDIACLDADTPQESITIENVLEKQSGIEHEDEIRGEIYGKRVLITGAGGSIGAELVRQLCQFQPASITLLDNNEYNLFQIQREFSENCDNVAKHFALEDICNMDRLVKIFDDTSPEIVFHAAAYKHVPMLEKNCRAAFVNNVIGTRNVLRASSSANIERFVLVSTDKAVDPSSVMGSSKRLAELLTQYYSRALDGGMSTAIVRFGNVINSTGSVIPLFKEQIISGGPITVTHPKMERYFMSITEAVQLILLAGTLGQHGEIYVLDMGKPVRIVDVARKMLALYGRKDIPIVFTGIRQGEKLTEKLIGDQETRLQTRFKKVQKAIEENAVVAHIEQAIAEAENSLSLLSNEQIGLLMLSLSNSEPKDEEIRVRANERA